jgi:hypothetical protein
MTVDGAIPSGALDEITTEMRASMSRMVDLSDDG